MNARRRCRGASLIVGMILLLMMTAVSLTSLKAIKTDERLAGNLQDRYLAFQAAEAALREAENFLEQATLPPFMGTAGLYRFDDQNVPVPFDFSQANARTYGESLTGVGTRPLYIVEQMESGVLEGSSLVVGVRYNGEQRTSYRTTALGFGGSQTTRVVLQSTFRR